jgi:hypothetical protein
MEGMTVVEHKNDPAARAYDAAGLPNGPLCVRRVMKDPERINDIERVVGKREVLCIGHKESARNSIEGKASLCQLDTAGREVYTCDPGSATGELQKIRTEPAADLKKFLSRELPEARQLLHEWLEGIPQLLDIIEEPPLSPSLLCELRSTGMRIPVVADTVLEIGVPHRTVHPVRLDEVKRRRVKRAKDRRRTHALARSSKAN